MCVIESTLTKLDHLKSPGFRIKDFNMCQTCEVVFISKDGFKELPGTCLWTSKTLGIDCKKLQLVFQQQVLVLI